MPLNLAAKILTQQINETIAHLEKKRTSVILPIYTEITRYSVDEINNLLKQRIKEKQFVNKQLDVILHTPGGDPDAAFNIGRLLQRHSDTLNIIIPRWAKSAGTLLSCAADNIIMFETAELGPLDAQFVSNDSNGNIVDSFSALAVKAVKEEIKKESKDNPEYARILAERMPDTIHSTDLERSLNIAKKYTACLLKERMLKNKNEKEINTICDNLVEGYSHHGYVIDLNEAKRLGLNANENMDIKEKINVEKLHDLYLKMDQLMQISRKINN